MPLTSHQLQAPWLTLSTLRHPLHHAPATAETGPRVVHFKEPAQEEEDREAEDLEQRPVIYFFSFLSPGYVRMSFLRAWVSPF